MTRQGTVAEKVRPILQAMERSIESARQRRQHGSAATAPRTENQPLRLLPVQPERPAVSDTGAAVEGTIRLKARPKRPA